MLTFLSRLSTRRRGALLAIPALAIVLVFAIVVVGPHLRAEREVVRFVPDHDSVLTVTVGLANEPDTLFPLTAQMPEAWLVLDAVLEPSLKVMTYTYQPGILTGIPTLENSGARVIGSAPKDGIGQDTRQITMTFSFRPDLRWADGTQVAADDAVFAFELAHNPDVDVPWPGRVDAMGGGM